VLKILEEIGLFDHATLESCWKQSPQVVLLHTGLVLTHRDLSGMPPLAVRVNDVVSAMTPPTFETYNAACVDVFAGGHYPNSYGNSFTYAEFVNWFFRKEFVKFVDAHNGKHNPPTWFRLFVGFYYQRSLADFCKRCNFATEFVPLPLPTSTVVCGDFSSEQMIRAAFVVIVKFEGFVGDQVLAKAIAAGQQFSGYNWLGFFLKLFHTYASSIEPLAFEAMTKHYELLVESSHVNI